MTLPVAIFGLDVTGWLSGQWWAYAIVFGACALDSLLFFLVPSEGVTIAAGVLAAQGRLAIWWVVAAAAVGVFSGDNATYWLGRLAREPIERRIRRSERGRRWLDQGHGLIHRNGEAVIVAGRFVPAGRSAATLSAGIVRLPWPRFAGADGAAAVAWAAYASMLGYLGGAAWQASFWKPFLVGLGVAGAVGGAAELWRRRERRHGRDVLGHDLDEDDAADEAPARARVRERERARR